MSKSPLITKEQIDAIKEQHAKERRKKHDLVVDNFSRSKTLNTLNEDQGDEDKQHNVRILLLHWVHVCREQCTLHSMCRSYYRFWENTMFMVSIVLSSATGISSLINPEDDDTNSRPVRIIFGIIGIISSVMMTIYRQLNLNELACSHDFYSTEYNKLKDDISMNLLLNDTSHKMFANLQEYVKRCKSNLSSLNERSPPIKEHIFRRYENFNKIHKNKKLNVQNNKLFDTLEMLAQHH